MGFAVGQCTKPLRRLDSEERAAFLSEVKGFVDFERQEILL